MSKLEIFYPTHFEKIYCHEDIAEIANRILQEYVEKNGVKVLAYKDFHGWWANQLSSPIETHSAILIQIEPIKKKCEHRVDFVGNHEAEIYKCYKCGVKLKAEWKEAE